MTAVVTCDMRQHPFRFDQEGHHGVHQLVFRCAGHEAAVSVDDGILLGTCSLNDRETAFICR